MSLMRAVPDDWEIRGRGHNGTPVSLPSVSERLDAGAKAVPYSGTNPPDSCDNSRLVLSILDQGQSEFCVEHGLAQHIRCDHVLAGIQKPEIASVPWLAYKVRKKEGTWPQNVGCDPQDAYDVLRHVGFPRASAMPWPDPATAKGLAQMLDEVPPPHVDREAFDQACVQSTDWATVDGDTEGALLDSAKRLLAAGHVLDWAGPVSNGFCAGEFDPSKPVDTPTSDIAGAHQMLVLDYDADGPRIVNSWSEYFAIGGMFRMTWDYLLAGLSMTALLGARYYDDRRP